MKKKYFPNNWRAIKDTPDKHFMSMPYEQFTDWKIHDIRRTVATNLTKLGVDRFLLQRVMNHTDTSVTKIYDRYNYLDEKREALQQWADRLDDIIR